MFNTLFVYKILLLPWIFECCLTSQARYLCVNENIDIYVIHIKTYELGMSVRGNIWEVRKCNHEMEFSFSALLFSFS